MTPGWKMRSYFEVLEQVSERLQEKMISYPDPILRCLESLRLKRCPKRHLRPNLQSNTKRILVMD